MNDKNQTLDALLLRRDFPILSQNIHGKPLVYFDNGASAQKPRSVLDAMQRFYENDYAITGENTRITVNMIHASFALRYYFWRSRFFIEGSYNYGFSKLKGSLDYFEQINNPAIGIGMNGTFFENHGIFTGKLSWEYSTKLRISTNYTPVNSYQSINRFAIIYHF